MNCNTARIGSRQKVACIFIDNDNVVKCMGYADTEMHQHNYNNYIDDVATLVYVYKWKYKAGIGNSVMKTVSYYTELRWSPYIIISGIIFLLCFV